MFPLLRSLLCVAGGCAVAPPVSSPLTRLSYHHPGLVADLAVGLWAWPLPMDFDGDGDLDLVVNCPDQPSNGVYFFENTTGDTAQNKLPVFKPGRRISAGYHNVQVSFVDGQPRVLAPGLEYPDFLKTGLAHGKTIPVERNIHPNKVRANMWRIADFDGDGLHDLVVGVGDWTEYGWDNAYSPEGKWTNGPLRGWVYWVRNVGSNTEPAYAPPQKIQSANGPVETFGWPSPNLSDFDGDGDLDLLCGEFLDGFTYFENIGSRQNPQYAASRRVTLPLGIPSPTPAAWLAAEQSQTQPGAPAPLTMDLEMITPTAIDWDKDGDLDLIVGDEDGRVAFVENTGRFSAQNTPLFLPPVYFQQEADTLKCGALATPVGFDMDGDGDTDLVSGNSAGYLVFFENLSGPGVEHPKWASGKPIEAGGKRFRVMAGRNGSIQGPAEAKWGYTTLSIADWDHDGLPDIVLNSILGRIVWLKNTGTREKFVFASEQPVEVEWIGAQPELRYGWLRPDGKGLLTQWRTTPVAVDWNRDGLTDLVMLDHEGVLALFERTVRDGKTVLLPPRQDFCDETGHPLLLNKRSAGASGRRKLCVVDWDGDGKLDLLLNSKNANLLRQVESRDGKWLFKDMGPLSTQNVEGHDVSPTTVDFNADGVPDFLGGAEDGRFYYLRNTPATP